jgi:2-polyprenyl-3-methyl-5-hydroxy-6-metoxy-1,4-benzoquinol methylase
MALTKPQVHKAEWSLQQVTDFWDNYRSIPHFRKRFFTLVMGEGILECAAKFISTKGVFLDYGCGTGELVDVLLRRGRTAIACDSSSEMVRAANERFDKKPGFLGAFTTPVGALPQPPDVITLVEVIEHVPAFAAEEFLTGVAALLPAGGHIFISCPNAEDLAAAEVLCPECGCQFHQVQHLQSLTPEAVATVAAAAGFEKVFAGATRFRRVGESKFKGWLYATGISLFGKGPHLVYIGRKR